MKKKLAPLLALLLLAAIGTAAATDTMPDAATPFAFPNGLTWDAALEDVRLAENAQSETNYLLHETAELQEFWFESPPAIVSPAGTYYVFRKDQLACVGIDYFPHNAENFDALQNDLTTAYGEPAETDPAQVIAMFDAYKESFPPELLYSQTGWTLADGTIVYYLNIADELYVFYVNADRLFAAGAE